MNGLLELTFILVDYFSESCAHAWKSKDYGLSSLWPYWLFSFLVEWSENPLYIVV